MLWYWRAKPGLEKYNSKGKFTTFSNFWVYTYRRREQALDYHMTIGGEKCNGKLDNAHDFKNWRLLDIERISRLQYELPVLYGFRIIGHCSNSEVRKDQSVIAQSNDVWQVNRDFCIFQHHLTLFHIFSRSPIFHHFADQNFDTPETQQFVLDPQNIEILSDFLPVLEPESSQLQNDRHHWHERA